MAIGLFGLLGLISAACSDALSEHSIHQVQGDLELARSEAHLKTGGFGSPTRGTANAEHHRLVELGFVSRKRRSQLVVRTYLGQFRAHCQTFVDGSAAVDAG